MQDYTGAGGKKPKSPTVTDDNLFSEDTVELVLALGEGEIEGFVTGDERSFYVGGTPLLAADGVTRNFKTVEPVKTFGFGADPTYLPVEFRLGGETSTVSVNVTLSKDIPVLRLTPPSLRGQIRSIEFRLVFAQLFIENEDGNFNNTARFQIAFRPANGGGPFSHYRDVAEYTITGKTSSGYAREFVIGNLPPLVDDDWEIKVIKFNNDINTEGSTDRQIAEIVWESFQCVTNTKRAYPDTAVVQIVAKSGDQFSSIPDFYGDYKGAIVEVPTNYNGHTRTYSGPWAEGQPFKKEWTDNPAWILRWLIMNQRFGLAHHYQYIQTDPFNFLEAAMYCDERVPDGKGGLHPRFSLNALLDTQELAFEKLQFLAGSFNANLSDPSNGKLYVRVDKWREPSVLFTPESVSVEGFHYTFSDGDTRYNDITVSFINPDLGYEPDRRRIYHQESIDANGRIPFEFDAVGCTNIQEALRRAYMRMATAEYEVCQVTFVTSRVGLLVQEYDNIWVADASCGWGVSGRFALPILGSEMVVRDPIFITQIKPCLVTVQGYFGLITFEAVPANPGYCTAFQITGVPTGGSLDEIPEQAVFAIQDAEENSFGLIKPFRVLHVEEMEDNPHIYRITALEVNQPKYEAADNVEPSEEVEYSFQIPDRPLAPYDLQAFSGTGQLQINGDGTVTSRISVEWKIPARAFLDHIEVQYQVLASDQWNTLTTTGNQIYISPVTDGAIYEIQVRAVNGLGRYSSAVYLIHTVTGKSEPPSDVENFNAQTVDYGLRLSWDNIPDPDLGVYEIRFGRPPATEEAPVPTWETASLLVQIKGTEYAWNMQVAGLYQLFIKAIDTSGNYSLNATETTAVVEAPNAVTLRLTLLATDIVLDWIAPDSRFPVASYEVRRSLVSETFEEAEVVGTTSALQFKLTAKFQGDARLWVAPIDAIGNRGAPGYVDFTLQLPTVSSVRVEVIDNNVLLRWVSEQGSFPIDHHLIRRGETLLASEAIYESSGTFAAILENKSGLYTYWIIPVDSAGNLGTAYSVKANVSQPPDYVLFVDQDSTFSGTKVNMGVLSGALVGAVNTTETYDDHFDSHGYASWQDAIDDGYPYFLTPALTTCSYEEVIDFGTILSGTTIRVLMEKLVINGSLVSSMLTLSTRATLSDPWLDFVDQDYVATGNFQYLKILYEAELDSDAALLVINRLNTKLDTKLKTDAGNGTALAADVGGTEVLFSIPFFDVQSIVITPLATMPVTPVYDFVDAPNPTSFKVLLFNALTGDRVDGPFSYNVRGY